MAGWPYPRLIAHRGGGALAPENTLAAFECGLRHGYRAAEIDAVLAADGVPVLLHDADLERTTDGHGCVSDLDAATLGRLDAGSWFAPQFAGVRIPTLEAALRFCCEHGIWLNVEIKPVPGHEERTGAIVAETVARFHGAAGTGALAPLLSSFSRTALASARRAAPALPRGLLFTQIPADWLDALRELDCRSLHCDHRRLGGTRARQVKERGYGLLCYTVDEPTRARRLWHWGVDSVCIDRIDRFSPADSVAPPA